MKMSTFPPPSPPFQKIYKTPLRAEAGRDTAWASMCNEHSALSRLGATSALPPPGIPRAHGAGVVKASGYGDDAGGAPPVFHAWLATQLLSHDVWRVMHASPKPPLGALLAAYGAAALDALEAVHAAGLVHRDVKPDNMCLPPVTAAEGGAALYLVDFGGCVPAVEEEEDGEDENDASADGESARGARRRRRAHFMGTPHYAALASLTEDQDPCCAHDVESLALVFLEWASPDGRLPWGARFKSAVDARSWTADARAEMAAAREADWEAAVAEGRVPWFVREMVALARAVAARRGVGPGRVSFTVLRALLRAGLEQGRAGGEE